MSQPIIEPNFEGEEMKIPEGMAEVESSATPTKSVLNTTVIIILVLALIAIFTGLGYWYYLVMNNTPMREIGPDDNAILEIDTTNEGSVPTETTTEVTTSDEIDALEADINNTELEELDKELNQIDAELEAELGAE